MTENIGPIKNPLTIIAIFAGLAEISGTVVLPFIDASNQQMYIWFLILFPSLLIALFFVTLNFNHCVLYAPSDYQNEDNFFRNLRKATVAEKIQKFEDESSEAASEDFAKTSSTPSPDQNNVPADSTQADSSRSEVKCSYRYRNIASLEGLVLDKLSTEFSAKIQRDVKFGNSKFGYVYDGIVFENGRTTVIEVKVVARIPNNPWLGKVLQKIKDGIGDLPIDLIQRINVIIAIVVVGDAEAVSVKTQFDSAVRFFPFPVEIRFFSQRELFQV